MCTVRRARKKNGVQKKYLEQLHADDGEHELQQVRDQHDVADRLDRHDHTLDHILRVFVFVVVLCCHVGLV